MLSRLLKLSPQVAKFMGPICLKKLIKLSHSMSQIGFFGKADDRVGVLLKSDV